MNLGTCTIFNGGTPITGTTSVCIGATTTLSNANTGTWSSSNTAVATINASGVVTGVAAGTATITFTNGSTGCAGSSTTTVTVNPKPTVAINNSNPTINLGASTTLSATSNMVGYWKFNESFGTTISDASGNNLTGTFVGGLGWTISAPFTGLQHN